MDILRINNIKKTLQKSNPYATSIPGDYPCDTLWSITLPYCLSCIKSNAARTLIHRAPSRNGLWKLNGYLFCFNGTTY